MNKLTIEIARRDIGHLREHQANPKVGLSMREELYLQALEKAFPELDQQESTRQVTLREAVSEIRNLTDKSGGYNFEALREEQDADKCIWSFVDSNSTWASSCGEEWQFIDGGPEENRVRFCQGCGGKVVIHEAHPFATPQIDNDGWIEWVGGDRPVKKNDIVAFRCRDGYEHPGLIESEITWRHDGEGDDIIAYRVIENDGRQS